MSETARRTSDKESLPIDSLMAGFRNVFDNKYKLVAISLVMGGLAYYLSSYLPVRYASTMTISINGPVGESVAGGPTAPGDLDKAFLNTQFELLTSRDLAERVALASEQLVCSQARKPLPTDPAALHKSRVFDIMRNVEVIPVRNTGLFKIQASCSTPAAAKNLAEIYSMEFIASKQEEFIASKDNVTAWMRDRMDALSHQVEAAEKALQEYKEKEAVYSSRLGTSVEEIEVARLLEAYSNEQKNRAQLAALHQQIKGLGENYDLDDLMEITAIREDPIVSQLIVELSGVSANLNSLKQRYESEHPELHIEQIRYDQLLAQLNEQLQVVSKGIGKRLVASNQALENLQKDIATSKENSILSDRKTAVLEQLERNVEVNRQLYRDFMTRVNDPVIAQGYVGDQIKVVGKAYQPESPSSPKRQLYGAFGFGGAFMLISLFYLVRGLRDETLKTSTDVEQQLNARLLGLVPHVRANRSPLAYDGYLKNSRSVFSEAIRSVRTGLFLLSAEKTGKVTVVTSSVPDEGKSTIALNLAASFGQLEKVLLLDADVTRPMLGQTLGTKGAMRGLMNVLSGSADIADCIYQGNKDGYAFMPAGWIPAQAYNSSDIPRDPLELLTMPMYKAVLNRLKSEYDHIIIDSGPVFGVSATKVLSALSTNVVYVVAAFNTQARLVRRGLKELKSWNANVSGVVLNKVDFEKMRRDDFEAHYPGYNAIEPRAREITEA